MCQNDLEHGVDQAGGHLVHEGRAFAVKVEVSVGEIEAEIRKAWGGELACYRETDPSAEDGYVMVCSPVPDKRETQNLLRAFRKSFTRTHWPLRLEAVEIMPDLPSGKPDTGNLKSANENHIVLWRQMLR